MKKQKQAATKSSDYQQRVLENVGVWAAYYRSNPHRFVLEYLHVKLKLFQMILLFMMNISSVFVFIACRGLGKSFLCAVFCCMRAILYPGEKVAIASGTRGQAVNVLEKIQMELIPRSPELAAEIDDKKTKYNGPEARIVFKNGSSIKVVTANDNARGNRAHVLIIDEFRMVKKDIIDTILRKFLANPRHPEFMNDPQYKGKKDLREPLMTMYLSSAYYKDHWSFTRARDSCRFMLDERRSNFVCGFPYQLALYEDLLMEENVVEQMTESDFNEIKWCMEMQAEFWGDVEGSFYPFTSISANRKIEYPMLPNRYSGKLPQASKLKIPTKQPGERRVLSADIALMASTKHKNDASAIFINQMMPTKTGRYTNNIVYTENTEGMLTDEQALMIRKMYDEYDCDYIVLDIKNVGLSIYDALARDMTDPDTGEIYPALSCCNNSDMAARCAVRDAPKVIWAISGNAKFNSDCALLLREGFRTGRIRLLVSEYDGEQLLSELKGYASLSPSERVALTLPYINTTLLISELVNLRHEESGGLIKVFEKAGMRKDRYSSLSYNYWVSNQLEKKLREKQNDDFNGALGFNFRAPKIK